MKRSLVLVLLSVFAVLVSAAVYAQPPVTLSASDVSNVVNGTIVTNRSAVWPDSVPAAESDAQALVGVTVDRLTHEMGTADWVSSDGNGGQMYAYQVRLVGAIHGQPHMVNEYFDVGSNGTVAGADVNVD